MTTPYLKKNHQTQMVEVLQAVLADSFALYFKTHAYHWNVEGPHFDSLHKLFGDQYTELWAATDVLAERIRALGSYAPMTLAEMTKPATIKPAKGGKIDAMVMVKDLAAGHAALSKIIAESIDKASDVGDEVTADMLIARQAVHDKAAWMLNATAG